LELGMKRNAGILVAVYAAVLAINLETTIVNVALPSMARELSAGTRSLQWIVDGYNLAFAGLVLAAGSLSDRYGRRPALVVGLLGFAAASVAGAEATSAGALVAARAAMGVFAALVFPTTLSVISNAFTDRRQRAAALGGWGAVVGVGVAAGPVAGGALLSHFYWGSVLLALAPVALLAAVLAWAFVPESRDPGVPSLDRRGLVLSAAMLTLLTYTVIEAPQHGWLSVPTVLGVAGSLVLAAAFVRAERRAPHPMLDVGLFADRRFSAASGAVTITFFALSGFIFLITQYFQIVRGYGALSTGVRILPVALSIAVASLAGGVLAPRVGTRAVVTTGLVLFGSAMAWVGLAAEIDTPYAAVVVPQMLLMGLGMGLVSTPATESIMRVLPPARAGVGSAVNDATRQLGATLGVAVVGSVFSSVFSSVFAGNLAASTADRLPAGQLHQAQDSVAAAVAMSGGSPEMLQAVQDAFMAGLHTGCLLVAAVCLAGALAGLVALPGRRFRPAAELSAA
jgi:EmrB/QacA subfamily drug resistance transporter